MLARCEDTMPLMLRAIVLGQGLSVLIALTGVFSSILVREGVSLPASQSVLNYTCLAVVYGSLLIRKLGKLRAEAYKYAALAALDVLANFCLVQAYRYTTLTSVTLLDCFTVPCVLLLSWLWLHARYKAWHWAGAFICLAGLALLVTTDTAFSSDAEAPSPMFGDGLVLLGAALYAVSNVAQEKMLGDVERVELLGMLGAFGSLWGGILATALEGRKIAATSWTAQVLFPFLGFNAALFAFSSLVPFVLCWGGAATLNLSLLSADLWAALARILFFGGFTAGSAAAFILSFLLVGGGLVSFTVAGEIYDQVSDDAGQKRTEKGPGDEAFNVEPHSVENAEIEGLLESLPVESSVPLGTAWRLRRQDTTGVELEDRSSEDSGRAGSRRQ